MERFVEGIVFFIIGLVITLAAIFAVNSLPVGIVGGLFMGAGIIWIIDELIKKNKK